MSPKHLLRKCRQKFPELNFATNLICCQKVVTTARWRRDRFYKIASPLKTLNRSYRLYLATEFALCVWLLLFACAEPTPFTLFSLDLSDNENKVRIGKKETFQSFQFRFRHTFNTRPPSLKQPVVRSPEKLVNYRK